MAVGRLARRGGLRWWGQGVIAMLLSGLVPAVLAEEACIALNGNPIQGGVLWGVASPSAKISFAGLSVPVMPDGSFLLGLGRDMPSTNQLEITQANHCCADSGGGPAQLFAADDYWGSAANRDTQRGAFGANQQ